MVQEISELDCTENGLVTNSPKQKGVRPRFYISFALNVFFLGAIFCWVVLRSVNVSNKECPTGPNSKLPQSTMPQVEEDTFYECSPCKPMMMNNEAGTMRLYSGNSSYVCCKKISSNTKLMVSVNKSIKTFFHHVNKIVYISYTTNARLHIVRKNIIMDVLF